LPRNTLFSFRWRLFLRVGIGTDSLTFSSVINNHANKYNLCPRLTSYFGLGKCWEIPEKDLLKLFYTD
jgi:hypothetical protein